MTGLLIDYGGVLTTSVFESFQAFCRAEGLEPDAVLHLFLEDEEALGELHRLERGELGEEEFAARLGPRLGVSSDGLLERLFARMKPEPEMLAAVRAARGAGLRTALVSNSWGLAMYDQGALDGLFDATVLSGEVGLRKPEPEIFLLAGERVGLQPADCVFVDDLRPNCAAAAGLGMTAVLHRGARETVAELERLLGIQLRARVREG